jgi:hypothetical protein
MRSNWIKHITGYLFIIIFLFNGIVPDVMILSGHLKSSTVSEAVAEQDDGMNPERNTEEIKENTRTEFLADIHTSFYIHPSDLFFISNYIIPRNTQSIQAINIPVPTPPPDIVIV